MRSAFAVVLCLFVVGCASTLTQRGQSPYEPGDARITVPDIFDLPKDRAIAVLRAAGYEGEVSDAPGGCGSVVDGRVIELGHVCAQQPSPGTVQGRRVPIALRVQGANPWQGDVGKGTEWRLMPRLVGMSLEAARAELARVGFREAENINVVWVDKSRCARLTVCETYPEAMNRFGIHSGMNLFVAGDPAADAGTSSTTTRQRQ